MTIPQEIVDEILGEVDDIESLKSCALVALKFCTPSQRILLHSLTVESGYKDSHPSNYTAVLRLLTESPHIALYIRELTIKLPAGLTALQDIETLRWILAKMTKVQHCTLTVKYIQDTRWSSLNPILSSTILDFITKQRLRSITLACLPDIPLPVLLRLITSTSRLDCAFLGGDLQGKKLQDLERLRPPSLDCLILDSDSRYVTDLLARPESEARTRNLIRLAMPYENSMVFIRRAAVTLKQIRLDCRGLDIQSKIIPSEFSPLPSLRSVEIKLSFWNRDEPWLIDLISCILTANSTATIEEVIVAYGIDYSPPVDISESFRSFLTKLEDLPFQHPAAPRIRWRLAYANVDVAQLVNLIKIKMPRLHATGRLVFESYDLCWSSEWLAAS
ncbi:hypothetical protein C8F04DRAFT_1179441 [Mycena alexandri]|uniref:F-box domain-containing protein n=1 Tax=Mycena alexandri TaxID=1745969 RepID=A0AAD6X4K2_9AGAR|nr:hypothetical protein C8F04DRAFT_1179441 [Mycena alexandri]